jgi:hypothetical protein
MEPSPVAVVLAKARVRDDAQIEVLAPQTIHVQPKQRVHVKFIFSVEETSRDRDNWRFFLESKIGDAQRAPQHVELKDHWGVRDDGWGTLHQEYSFDLPGRYEGTFEVIAENRRQPWRSSTQVHSSRCIQTGSVQIVVDKL